MAIYSYEERLAAVLRCIEDGMSYRDSAKILGTHHSVVERWIARYKQFGPEGLLLKHGSYDGVFKVSVIEYMHANHLSLFRTAVKFGIPSDVTVGKWERIYYEKGPQGLYQDNRGRKSKMSSAKPKKLNKKRKKI